MAKKAYKRTGDMLFHRIIGNSSYPEVTAGFISDIMGVAVEGVQILNPYSVEWYRARSEDPELMTTGVDVLVSLRDGTRFIVECQQAPQSFFLGRVFFYAASRYIENYAGAEPPDLVRTSGYKYKSLHSVHTIALTSFVLFEADDAPMHRFVMYDVDNGIPYDPEVGGVGISGPVSFTFLELAKLMKADNRLIQLWVDFFRGVELQADAPDYLKRAEWLAEE
ncbi:MAG: Rpn family recombination-promoting nuclease/putative transposase, partial [Coriobacteriia bacterium]|nr:Rpn family recombination-promoting nuclease/putative transposase [Coriobacteriia bacterium]